MTVTQISIVALIGTVFVLIAVVFRTVVRAKQQNAALSQADELSLRRLPVLREAQTHWPLYTLTRTLSKTPNLLTETWLIAQKNNAESAPVGELFILAGPNEGTWGSHRFQIFVGDTESRWIPKNQLMIKQNDELIRSWDLNRRSIWKRMREDQFLWFSSTRPLEHYEMKRDRDRYELRLNGERKGLISLGGFEGRIAAIDPSVPPDVALSLFYSSLLPYEGPRVGPLHGLRS